MILKRGQKLTSVADRRGIQSSHRLPLNGIVIHDNRFSFCLREDPCVSRVSDSHDVAVVNSEAFCERIVARQVAELVVIRLYMYRCDRAKRVSQPVVK